MSTLGIDPFEVKDDDKIAEIKGTITFADGQKVKFLMDGEHVLRWGNDDKAVIARAVLPTEEMELAVSNEDLWEDS